MIDCLVMELVGLVMDCLVIMWGLVGLMIGIVIDLVWSWVFFVGWYFFV